MPARSRIARLRDALRANCVLPFISIFNQHKATDCRVKSLNLIGYVNQRNLVSENNHGRPVEESIAVLFY
jgi:hypothetical protein